MVWCQNLVGYLHGQPHSQSQDHELTQREVETGMSQSLADCREGGLSDSVAHSRGRVIERFM